ncbi:MAG TPA: FAD-linked oxidase C-terminal domain-containing protein [Tepidisphaeraceae bacterium]|jgi:glycolate oxidase
MSRESVIRELETLLSHDSVISDPSELLVYESDGFTIAKSRPSAVLFPTSAAEASQIMKLLNRHDIQIIPRGSGTGLAGGCVAFEGGIIISTSRMNRILQIDIQNRVAHVEAGVRNTQLSEAVSALPGGSALHFAPDPSSQRASTIGGNAATNAGGIHTLKDFVSSNHVFGIEMVLSDGTILQTGGENGACERGPIDLVGLICGSEGTLGIITSLWVRLAPKPLAFRTIVGTFASSSDASSAVAEIIATGLLPAAMEMMDGQMVRVIEDAFSFGLPPNAEALLLTEIDGIDELLDEQADRIVEIHKKYRAITVQSSGDPARRQYLWKVRKNAFGAIGRISHSYCTQDACVPRSMLVDVLKRIDEIGREHGMRITNVFHAGDGNVHPIFLYDDTDEEQVQNTLRAAQKVLQFCVDVGGTITGEHGVGVEKIHLMPYLFDEPTMNLFSRIKKAFDPDERINAGKMVPSEKVNIRLLKPGRHVPQ